METLPKINIKLMTTLIQNNQPYIKKLLSHFLRENYKEVHETKEYIYAIGDIPIALVAHMDTVWEKELPKERQLFYDKDKGVMFSPQGAGFDDKAGIYSIIQIVKSGLRPHVIFTTDEETGCIGGSAIASIPCPFEDLRYIIQLDRRHVDDCVFYDCDNPEFISYVEEFGFVEHFGSFSDISVICPSWGIAGVNLSVGYENEHTRYEILYVQAMQNTIEKVKKMLTAEMPKQFKYIPLVFTGSSYYSDYGIHQCPGCKQHFFTEEIFPTITKAGTIANYCPDCLVSHRVSWCAKCGRPFEERKVGDKYCIFCAETKNDNTGTKR